VDKLHRVKVHAAFAARGEDRHNVGVMQACRGLRFVLEPLKLPAIQRRGERQYLERDAAAERNLLRFVDDSHAAAADLAEKLEVAEVAELHRRWLRVKRAWLTISF